MKVPGKENTTQIRNSAEKNSKGILNSPEYRIPKMNPTESEISEINPPE